MNESNVRLAVARACVKPARRVQWTTMLLREDVGHFFPMMSICEKEVVVEAIIAAISLAFSLAEFYTAWSVGVHCPEK